MAQCAASEKFLKDGTNAITGVEESGYLLHRINDAASRAESIDIIVSFIMESGAYALLDSLKKAAERGVHIRILTSNYMNITDPDALFLLKMELGENLSIRFYNETGRSFHAKTYIFNYGDYSDLYIGSSNISESALTYGVEWNYRLNSRLDGESAKEYMDTFEDLYRHHSFEATDEIISFYAKNRRKPPVSSSDCFSGMGKDDGSNPFATETVKASVTKGRNVPLYKPRGAQLEALYALQMNREDGADRAIISVSTGCGKTFISAFDAERAGAKRVLFVAHREEILKQAESTYKKVFGSGINSGFFMGPHKDKGCDFLFASVASLGKDNYLNEKYFERDYFDYIVIDEFHHAVNSQYIKIIDYFRPAFLLGLTATPDRLDGRDIYRICDYNVPFELPLWDAIRRDMLVPFRYYGIYDSTDYSELTLSAGKYRVNDLNRIYLENEKRNRLIYSHYMKHGSEMALGFCASRIHAEAMAGYFSKKGIPSAAVYSGSGDSGYRMDRDEALEALKKGDIRIIFSVDMFNEGLDVPAVDMVMFLRPTESPTIFLQQLGRGLRRHGSKKYLNVLDFIGNYKRAEKLPLLLTGRKDKELRVITASGGRIDDLFPEGCMVDFDMDTVDLFEKIRNRNRGKADIIYDEFIRVKEELGHVPSRTELFVNMDYDIYDLCRKNRRLNPFKNYLSYLSEHDLLSEGQERIFEGKGLEFISFLENTDMSRVYKMPVLRAFIDSGSFRTNITESEVLESWKKFFLTGKNWKDLRTGKIKTREDVLNMTDEDHIRKIKEMPVRYIRKSGGSLFTEKKGYLLSVNSELDFLEGDTSFTEEVNDAVTFRAAEYFRNRE